MPATPAVAVQGVLALLGLLGPAAAAPQPGAAETAPFALMLPTASEATALPAAAKPRTKGTALDADPVAAATVPVPMAAPIQTAVAEAKAPSAITPESVPATSPAIPDPATPIPVAGSQAPHPATPLAAATPDAPAPLATPVAAAIAPPATAAPVTPASAPSPTTVDPATLTSDATPVADALVAPQPTVAVDPVTEPSAAGRPEITTKVPEPATITASDPPAAPDPRVVATAEVVDVVLRVGRHISTEATEPAPAPVEPQPVAPLAHAVQKPQPAPRRIAATEAPKLERPANPDATPLPQRPMAEVAIAEVRPGTPAVPPMVATPTDDAVQREPDAEAIMVATNAPERPAEPATPRAAPVHAYRPATPELHTADRIALAVRHAVSQGSDHIQIQLWPEHLGRVDVRLDVDDDNRVRATVTADRAETHDLLQRDAKGLERALEQSGLKVAAGDVTFSWRQGGQQNPGFGHGAAHGQPWRGRDEPLADLDDVIAAASLAWRDPARLIDLSA